MRIRLRDEISPQINFLIIQRRFGARLGVPYFHMHIAISHLAFPTRFQASDRSSDSDEVPVKDDDSDFLSNTLVPLATWFFHFSVRSFLSERDIFCKSPATVLFPRYWIFFPLLTQPAGTGGVRRNSYFFFIWRSFCSKFVLSSCS